MLYTIFYNLIQLLEKDIVILHCVCQINPYNTYSSGCKKLIFLKTNWKTLPFVTKKKKKLQQKCHGKKPSPNPTISKKKN